MWHLLRHSRFDYCHSSTPLSRYFREILLDNLIKGSTVQRVDPEGDARADAMSKGDSGQPASFVDDHVAVLEDEVQL